MKISILAILPFIVLVFSAMMVSGLNPLVGDDWEDDIDGDGLIALDEFLSGSDPNNWDTDGDGLPDGWEVENGLSPKDPSDALNDNDYYGGEEYAHYELVDAPYDNYAEYYRFYYVDHETGENVYLHTDPNNPDSDGDGLLDPDDRTPLGHRCFCCCCSCHHHHYPHHHHHYPPRPPTPPNGDGDGDGIDDNDGDGITDLEEMRMGTDFNNPDTDGDGLIDIEELSFGLDPNDWDTDNDMLIDGVERGAGESTDGHVVDTDNDGTG